MAVGVAGVAGAEPTAGSLSIEQIATIPDMGRMAVNPATGEIAFGRTGPGAGSAQFLRVLGTDGSLHTVGDQAIRDPDAVAWDVDGLFSPAGSLLVGSNRGIFAIRPDNSIMTVMEAGSDLVNPEDLNLAADGGLYWADYGLSRVQRLSIHGSVSTVLTTADPVVRVDVDEFGSLASVDVMGGVIQPGAIAGTPNFSELVFGDGSDLWGDDRYALDTGSGSVVRLFDDGSIETVVSGLFDGVDLSQPHAMDANIAFLPTGEMLIGVPVTGELYSVVPAPGALAIAAMGGVLAVRRRR
ncbi:MAG TPA: hypothetical protein ENJ00_00995 [Phycisphaerales bacterium]|nr:hypothetical protein [Phycisphaerales bacterium]